MTTDPKKPIGEELLVDRAVPSRPPALRFLITDGCNLRCSFCHNEFQGDVGAREERLWNWRLVTSLLTDTAARSDLRVKISGGEPTLRWGILLRLMRLAADAGARDLTLFSNLTTLSDLKIGALRDAGLKRVATNLPSFRTSWFADRTGQSRWPVQMVLNNARLLRESGINVQFNVVVPTFPDESLLASYLSEELSAAESHLATFDTVALVADDWAARPDDMQSWIRGWLASERGLPEDASCPYRSHEFRWIDRRLLVSRCTSWSREEEVAEADVYVVPPGVPLRNHVRGRAYRGA